MYNHHPSYHDQDMFRMGRLYVWEHRLDKMRSQQNGVPGFEGKVCSLLLGYCNCLADDGNNSAEAFFVVQELAQFAYSI